MDSKVIIIQICVASFGYVSAQAPDKFTGMISLANMASYPEETTRISHSRYTELLNGQKSFWSNLVDMSNTGIQDGGKIDPNIEAISEYTLQDAGRLAATPNYNVSELCLNHTMLFLEALMQGQQWALSMLDATGKLPSGVLEGNLVWRGAYRECLNVIAVIYSNVTSESDPIVPFHGRYCKLSIPLQANASLPPSNPIAPGLFGGIPVLTIGMCMPDSCDGQDLVDLVNSGLSVIPVKLSDYRIFGDCPKVRDLSGDTAAIVVIVLLSCIGAVILFGTGYDIVRFQIPKYLFTLPSDDSGLTSGYLPLPTEASTRDISAETTLNKNAFLLRKQRKNGEEVNETGPGLCGKLLLSFSVYTNGMKIVNTEKTAGSLTCIHGVRFLSMTWVMLGHTYVFGLASGDNLGSFIPEIVRRWTFQAVSNATYSVDSFFLLSGLLVGYLTWKEMDKGRGKLNWLKFYFHRFWRLTPPYMLVLMVYVPLFKYWSDGPQWPVNGVEVYNCDSWWTNLLYINNVVNVERMCMGWSWYLSNDMQFFVISPLILIPFYFSAVAGGIVLLLSFLGTFLATGLISKHFDADTSMLNAAALDNFEYIYIKPWCRIGPYLVGLFIGYVLYSTKCKIKLHFTVVLIGWLAAIGCCLSVLYGLYDVDTHTTKILSPDVGALYSALSRTAWAAGVGWLIFACCIGYGGFVNTLLSWGALIPLSRLTYTSYLVHPIVMVLYYNSLESPISFSDLNVIYLFFGHLVLSYMVAFVVSLAFEAPMMGLEKVLLRREKNS